MGKSVRVHEQRLPWSQGGGGVDRHGWPARVLRQISIPTQSGRKSQNQCLLGAGISVEAVW